MTRDQINALLTDPVVKGCLHQIARRNMASVGALADYLEEHSLPGAARVRDYWDQCQERLQYWEKQPDDRFLRRRHTRWEVIAAVWYALWFEVRQEFRRTWKTPRYELFNPKYRPPKKRRRYPH